MSTWGDVHVGDSVRGADQRVWSVIERHVGPAWKVGGATGRFVLRLDGRDLSIMRRLDELVERLKVYDHSGEHVAAATLLGAGLDLTIVSEETVSVEADPFTPPAPVRRGDAPTGQYGWYKLPHPVTGEAGVLWPRVSTIAKTLVDTYGLEQWKLRMVAKGVAVRADLVAKAAALDVDTDKRDFGDVVSTAMDVAEASRGANYGTAMHKFAERLDDGESIAAMHVPAELRGDIEAYAATLKAAGLRVLPQYSERVVVHADLGYGGRWDRVVADRAGRLYVLDLKTGKDVIEYGQLEIATQQAFYVNATHLALNTWDGYESMPELDRGKSLILHLPLGKGAGTVYGLDIGKGWAAAQMALATRELRSAARSGWMWVYAPATADNAVALRVARAQTLPELMAASADARRLNAWTPELEATALSRYDIIRIGEAAGDQATLAALWEELYPAGRWTDEIDALTSRTAT